MKKFSLSASIIGLIAVCLFSMTSCLKGGDETMSLEAGEASELILGQWKVDECIFTYTDAQGNTIKQSVPDNTFLDTLLEFDFSGECYVGEGMGTWPWNIDAATQEFWLNGTNYHLVSIGKNLFVIEISGTYNGQTGTFRYLLVHMSGGEAEDTGIPSDELATPNPEITDPNTSVPNIQVTGEGQIISIFMTGIYDPVTGGWLDLYGTGSPNQNVWVSVDGKPKGILVINNEDNSAAKAIDLVFLVDNSGSMREEADLLAAEIQSWATELSQQNLDIRFGCVGYAEAGNISGALNLTGLTEIHHYLNRTSGTSRTEGFAGSDASVLQSFANSMDNPGGECGARALFFADHCFSFRPGANRIYVNFTDEPNQTGGYSGNFSVEFVNDQTNWNTSQGTIHTVYSASPNFTESSTNEKPWRLSEYTGGTTLYANSDFSDVSLSSLPVTGAMTHSYIIKFLATSDMADGLHEVLVTIQSKDGTVRTEKLFVNVDFNNE